MAVSIVSHALLTIGLTVLTATSSATPQTPQIAFPALSRDFVYVVKPDDTLSSIAKKFYDSEDYWTTVWNDNPEISDQNVITAGMKLHIRMEKPLLIEEAKVHPMSDEVTTTPIFMVTPSPEVSLMPPSETTSPTPTQEVSVTPQSTPTSTVTYTGGPLSDAQLDFLGNCESGMTATRNSGNGFYGAFQFMIGTWNHLDTGYERADLAPLDVQKAAVQKLLSHSSIFNQFPGCARKMVAAGLI